MAGARRSRCPVSCTLDVLGDRWSLLVVRDLLRDKHRFGEFTALAERLRRLKTKGIIRSRRYSGAPPRVEYHLTAKGEALRPIVRAMVDWGVQYAGGAVPPGFVVTLSGVVPAPPADVR